MVPSLVGQLRLHVGMMHRTPEVRESIANAIARYPHLADLLNALTRFSTVFFNVWEFRRQLKQSNISIRHLTHEDFDHFYFAFPEVGAAVEEMKRPYV
jgi:hypothetical protein